jgi:uridine phosphorylase
MIAISIVAGDFDALDLIGEDECRPMGARLGLSTTSDELEADATLVASTGIGLGRLDDDSVVEFKVGAVVDADDVFEVGTEVIVLSDGIGLASRLGDTV